VRRSKTLPEGGHLLESKLSQLVKRLRKAVEESAKVRGITRDEEARAIWAKVYPALSEGNPGLLRAMPSPAEAHVVFGDALGDPLGDEILRLLRTTPDGVPQTEISNYFRRHKPAVQIVRALKLLTDQGLVT
jgi:DNA-binding transcriptional ArsR family regulator